MDGYLILSDRYDPYYNLALEWCMQDACAKCGGIWLYFWQNDKTIVIGRHQNAYTECNMEFAQKHGITVARRTTGGGAVYHDRGNLNFTVICPKKMFNKECSMQMLVAALVDIGIPAALNGRNDVCVENRKISGNAFSSNDAVGLHHGTILFNADMSAMEQALHVSPHKLSKHGIASLRSRVVNISALSPKCTLDDIKASLLRRFSSEFNIAHLHQDFSFDPTQLANQEEVFRSDAWIFKTNASYIISKEQQFSWGNLKILIDMEGEQKQSVAIETDCLEADLITALKQSLHCHMSHDDANKIFEAYRNTYPHASAILTDIENLFGTLPQ